MKDNKSLIHFEKEKIIKEKLDYLIGEKFGNYSKYIIQERALPDLRDGLKPVQRRVLYAMNDLRLTHKSSYKKSARVVGDVIGKYHPHGDTSVYDAMVRLSQEWKVNMPLVDMHGNKGSIDGDSPAAMRYTEVRLAKISSELLLGIEKNLVSFSPNFDDSELEPTVLPARYPNLLVNGATGIASGYSTNIPPHNLKEVIDALIYILRNDHVTLSNITKFIKAPDFPTGGIISSKKSIRNAYKNGKGKVIIDSKWKYDFKNSEIHIFELPYETNKSEIVKKIDELIRENKIPGIKEVRDDTDRTGLRVTLLCNDNVNVELVMNFLLKSTDLRKSYSFNMVSIKDKKPELLGLVDILNYFAEFQIDLYTKLYNFELLKLKKRLEIVKGLIKVVDIIDEIIETIRKSKNKSDARRNIINEFKFTENQAEAIVTLRLYRLTSTDINDLKREKTLLNSSIKNYQKSLQNKEYLKQNIITELEAISNEYGIERKTEIKNEIKDIKIDEKDLIQEEEVWISVTHQGYIKKISLKSKEASAKGTFGKRKDDIIISLNKTSNLNSLIIFASSGKYFSIQIYKLLDSKYKDIGEHISKYTTLDALDRIVSTAIVSDFDKEGELIISTKKAIIKRSLIREMNINQTKRGSKYINLKNNDEVVSVSILKDERSFLTTVTKNGFSLRYTANNLSTTSLASGGVKNLNLTMDDEVISTIVNEIDEVDKGKSQAILIAKSGKAKRIKINEIRAVSRGSIGSIIVKKFKSTNDQIINAFNIDITDKIYILTDENKNINLKPKSDLILSDTSTGLNKLIDSGIKLVFNDVDLNIVNLRKYDEIQELKKETKKAQMNLDDLLNEF
ncbi:MAG: DNA topoisomerase 4 subunit A [Candidatus Tyloplasma litorale]|nr:MAG: DNA topoisomerase 4 subunit A [Mycoplasmatales bacterium]